MLLLQRISGLVPIKVTLVESQTIGIDTVCSLLFSACLIFLSAYIIFNRWVRTLQESNGKSVGMA